MRRTVECEAIVFELEALTTTVDEVGGCEAAPGARYLVGQLPAGRWAVVTSGTAPVARHRLEQAGLPAPSVLVATDVAPAHDDLTRALEELGADPAFSAIIAGTLSTLDALAAHDAAVITVASVGEPAQLTSAGHVVPSLSSVRVLGQHPILVLEVDTIPDL